jgi:hypothetical protein
VKDIVNILGVKSDGSTVLLGTTQMSAEMKAAEIAREYFGNFTQDDGSNAEYCFCALLHLIEWMRQQGWKAPETVVESKS